MKKSPTSLDLATVRVFSSRPWRRVLRNEKNDEFDNDVRLILSQLSLNASSTRRQILLAAFDAMSKNRRVEYFYRQKLASTILRRTPTRSAAIINELPIGFQVADVAHFGSVPHIYEVKSPFDSASRLSNQIDGYFAVAPLVTLVADEINEEYYRSHLEGTPVGMIVAGPRGGLKRVLDAKPTWEYLRSELLFDLLHDVERTTVLGDVAPQLGKVPSGIRYMVGLEAARTIGSDVLLRRMSREIRQRPRKAVPKELDWLAPVILTLKPTETELRSLDVWLDERIPQ